MDKLRLALAKGSQGEPFFVCLIICLSILHAITADVDKLKLALAKAEGDIDVLLTNEWPQARCCLLPLGCCWDCGLLQRLQPATKRMYGNRQCMA